MLGPGQTLEYSMFVTGRVKQALELSGAASRVIVTSAGSCAMLHFDSMVAISLPSSVSILSTQTACALCADATIHSISTHS